MTIAQAAEETPGVEAGSRPQGLDLTKVMKGFLSRECHVALPRDSNASPKDHHPKGLRSLPWRLSLKEAGG